MIAYFYIKKNDLDEALECGLKLSVYGSPIPESGEIPIRAIRGLLSPRDDMEKFNDISMVCLKLELPGDKLLIAEECYLTAEKYHWFNESIVHASNYMLGRYRRPCYLITFTVLGEYISILDKNRDVPVLYDNSSRLYISSLKSKFEETDPGFNDKALYGYMRVMVMHGMASMEWKDKDTAVFIMDGERYILKNPLNEI